MPKLSADEIHAETIERLLRENRALAHIRVRRRGDTLVLESGPTDDPLPHARLQRATLQWWTLEMPTHTGRWESTPTRAPLQQAFATLVAQYPWALTPIA